jgi:hypothetical protein
LGFINWPTWGMVLVSLSSAGSIRRGTFPEAQATGTA